MRGLCCFVICAAMIILTANSGDAVALLAENYYNLFKGIKSNVSVVDERPVYSENKVVHKVFSPDGFGAGQYEASDKWETPEDISLLMADAKTFFKKLPKSGNISEQQFGKSSQTISVGNVVVSNKSNTEINLEKYIDKKGEYGEITRDEPYILIYHTHTTEGYQLLDIGWYSDKYNSRTQDSRKNMVRVGEELCRSLERAGFKVIHDKNIYDESYNGAYSRSLVNVKKILEEYPSIRITLDVHRDAIHYDNGTKCKPTAVIEEHKAAQVMIITGCEGDGVENFPFWQQNLAFALDLQEQAEELFGGLMRPVFFCNRKYNMDVTPCSLLLEFGTDANTLEEAVYSANLIGTALGELLNSQ